MKETYKRVIENIISLGIINGINFMIPLVTLPYLIKTIGINNYGAYSIVYSMLQYGILFTAYGFGFSSTQQIAQNREEVDIVNRIVNATLFSRLAIMIIFIIIMGFICLIVYPKEYFIMYLWGLGIVLGDILNPTWLYQGMEKMKYMTIINLVCKSVFTILIFVFIRRESDYIYITLLNSIGYIIAGGISMFLGYRLFNIKLFLPKQKHIFE
ncbi:MAG: oligosaccharide flippase family protein, partial [Bacilli bacterium]|nr:oligosaccharide flippase family protein [Bacilli bacterium]